MATGPGPDVSLLLAQASHRLATEMAAALAGLGIAPRTHCVLSKALGGAYTQGQLAELCDLDKTTMVVTLDELEAAGLAERRPSPTDRRARLIAVTPAGARLVAEAQEIVDRVHGDALEALPARQRAAFVDGLSRLVEGRAPVAAVAGERPVRRRGARTIPSRTR
jgi:DNA-binding MarR family transcriptional regulator